MEHFVPSQDIWNTLFYHIGMMGNCSNKFPERLKELKSPFWKPEVQGKELMEALLEAKPTVDMIIKICTSLREYLPQN